MPKTRFAIVPFFIGASPLAVPGKDAALQGYVELESDLLSEQESKIVGDIVNDTLSKQRVGRVADMMDAVMDAVIYKYPKRRIVVQITMNKVEYIPEEEKEEQHEGRD